MPPPSTPEPLTGFGAGKVILLGEHGVVYGHSALAAPLSWGVLARGVPSRKCELLLPPEVRGPGKKQLLKAFDRAAALCGRPKVKISVESDLPVSMGLGSSAAFAVACARLLLKAAGRPEAPPQVGKLALEMEREFHGAPSGVDHTVSSLGELIAYRKRPGQVLGSWRAVKSRRPLKILVALVGQRGSTRQMVGELRERTRRWPVRYRRVFAEIGELANEGAKAIEKGDLEALGDAMTVNQGMLSALQLSSPPLDEVVHRLRKMGALGAKLTGAGGDGGAVIGLFLEPEPAVARLTRMGVRCFGSQLAGPRAL